ncbi:MAG: HAD family phosphatase [Phycisphaeraceae bacterium]
MIKAIVFDFDGVIVDSEPLHYRAFLKTAQDHGIAVDFDYREYLDKYVGFDDRDGFREMIASIDAGAVMTAEFPRTIETLCRNKRDVFRQIVGEGFETIPGVLELIANLPADFPIAIASGATHEDIALILGKLGIASRFNPIITASDVHKSKPDPQTYRMALAGLQKRAAMEPGEVVAIEDTAAGIESARGAGLLTLGITTTGTASLLHRAHRVIEGLRGLTLDDLQKWFG